MDDLALALDAIDSTVERAFALAALPPAVQEALRTYLDAYVAFAALVVAQVGPEMALHGLAEGERYMRTVVARRGEPLPGEQ